MKVLVKLLHTAVVEKTDPKRTVQRYLMAYRATTHRMTGKSLAELMFGGEVKAEGLHGCQAGCQGKGDEGSG